MWEWFLIIGISCCCGETDTVGDSNPEDELNAFGLMAMLGFLIIAIMVAYALHEFHVKYLPSSGAVIVLGAIGGLLAKLVDKNFVLGDFDTHFFFIVLLPPIIFESGYSLNHKSFFPNMWTVLTYAVVGTAISTAIVGIAVTVATHHLLDHPWNLIDGLVFGSLISATDPVSTLSLFSSLNADPLLYNLVFGESVMNDAVSVVLFRTFSQLEGHVDYITVFGVIGTFLAVALGSTAIGLLAGMLMSVIFKRLTLYHHPVMEISLVFLSAEATHMLCEGLGFSGIVSIFFFGVAARHWNMHNLSMPARSGSLVVFKTFAELSELIIFAFLGQSLVSGGTEDKSDDLHGFDVNGQVVLVAIGSALVARFLAIFGLTLLLNTRRKQPISLKVTFMIWNSGVRGAVAYALANITRAHVRRQIVGITQVFILFTIFIVGGLVTPIALKQLNLIGTEDDEEEGKVKVERAGMAKKWARLDRKYLTDFLCNKYVPRAPCREVRFTDDFEVVKEKPQLLIAVLGGGDNNSRGDGEELVFEHSENDEFTCDYVQAEEGIATAGANHGGPRPSSEPSDYDENVADDPHARLIFENTDSGD